MGSVVATGEVGVPAATLDEQLAQFQRVMAALFGFDGTDLRRIAASADGNLFASLRSGTTEILDTDGLRVQGSVAHDVVDAGNPLSVSGFATQDVSAEADVAAGDRVRLLATLKGAHIIAGGAPGFDGVASGAVRFLDDTDTEAPLAAACYGLAPDGLSDRLRTLGDVALDGLGQICATPAVPGAGVVTSTVVQIGANSATRATVITPTAATRIRVVSVRVVADGLTTDPDRIEIYFGTGANIDATPANAIGAYITGRAGSDGEGWPDGGGPVGAVDAVLSWRTSTETETGLRIIVQYREE